MRELTLLDTGYLAGLLPLCLVLPLLMSFRGPKCGQMKRLCMRTVWAGQVLLASAGLVVLFSARLAPYAAACGFVGYLYCAFLLLRHLRAARAA